MFERLVRIIGEDNLNKLKKSTVLVIGLGGVGGAAVEMLGRNGVENLILVDHDVVDITNKNRQLIAVDSTINMKKTDAFYNRLKDINKDINITLIDKFIDKDNIGLLFDKDIDFVIDACDTISTKILIIKECLKRDINFITCMGMGKKMDISKLEVTDINKTSYDKIAKVIRKKLKEDNITGKVPVLSSTENPVDTDEVIGSYSPVTNVAGIYLADFAIKTIIKS